MSRTAPVRGVTSLLGLMGLLGACLETPRAAGIPRTLIAAVERVSDGETVTAFTGNGTKLRIRLLGIDAPESGHEARPPVVGGEDCGRC